MPGLEEKRQTAGVWATQVAKENCGEAFGDKASPPDGKVFKGVEDLPEFDGCWYSLRKHQMWVTTLPKTNGTSHWDEDSG